MFDLTGKRALITGGAQGIGWAIAQAFAAHGATVLLNDRIELAAGQAQVQTLGANSQYLRQDLTEESAVADLLAQAAQVDILVVNASVQYRSHWAALSEAQIQAQLLLNVTRSYQLIAACTKQMQARNFGRVIAIGSIQQTKPSRNMLMYAASKAALVNMVQNVALQVAADGVTANVIAPGIIDTPRNAEALGDADNRARLTQSVPMKRIGTPQDVAGAALLLASDAGAYITGASIPVDGGKHL